jgi:hypothetical protein
MVLDLWSASVPAPAVRVSGQGRPTRGGSCAEGWVRIRSSPGSLAEAAGMMNHVAGYHAQLRAQFITGFRVWSVKGRELGDDDVP